MKAGKIHKVVDLVWKVLVLMLNKNSKRAEENRIRSSLLGLLLNGVFNHENKPFRVVVCECVCDRVQHVLFARGPSRPGPSR